MMKTRQVYLARLYYTIAKCTCQEVLRKIFNFFVQVILTILKRICYTVFAVIAKE